MAYRGNGPRAGRSTGRNRNSLVNNASRLRTRLGLAARPQGDSVPIKGGSAAGSGGVGPQTGGNTSPPPSGGGGGGGGGGGATTPAYTGPPPVSAASAAAYAGQLSNLQLTLYDRLAAIRSGKGLIQGTFQMAKQDAKTLGVEGVASAVNDALQREMVGSSSDLANRTAAVAAKQRALQEARQQKLAGLLGLKQDRISAMNEYFSGVFGVQMAKSAEQAQLAIAAAANDTTPNEGTSTGASPSSSEQAWGGYSNGKVPLSAMVQVPQLGAGTAPGSYLKPEVADAFLKMNHAARQDGVNLNGSGYRTYETQYNTYYNPPNDLPHAYPGTSNHGWGMAIDFSMTAEAAAWLDAHAAEYGFQNLAGDRPHWDYVG